MDENYIGPYRILGELGKGGMANVYRALQPSVNRIVALKVLPTYLESDEGSLKRFQQEAEIAANLAHPNIVKVWDASISHSPYYIAMEFLEGQTLSAKLEAGPLPVQEALGVLQAICSALGHAHARGIIHRDIKPDNIMFDGFGRPVVTDFGIARNVERERMTTVGATLGTADYMSPEQARGQQVGQYSDLYSAAVVLYEMLAGRPPFTGEEPQATMHQIIYESVPPLSNLGVSVPPAIEKVLQFALAKRPEERYQSVEEFSKALEEAAHTGKAIPPSGAAPTAAPKPMSPRKKVSPPPQPPKSTTAPQKRKALLASLLGVVVVLLGVATFQIPRGGGAPSATAPIRAHVPDTKRLTLEKAIQSLKDASLVPGKTEHRSSDSMPKALVIGSTPAAGTEVAQGSRVSLIVSDGAPAPPVNATTGPPPRTTPPPPPKFICRTCGKSLPSTNALSRHRIIHRQKQRFICTICKASFRSKSTLERHKLTCHPGGWPYPCRFDGCSAVFSSDTALQNHMRIHRTNPR